MSNAGTNEDDLPNINDLRGNLSPVSLIQQSFDARGTPREEKSP